MYKLVLRLIEKDEAELLERVVALPQVQDKSLLYDMMLEAHLACGNTEKAKELAKKDDFDMKATSSDIICHKLASTGKVRASNS